MERRIAELARSAGGLAQWRRGALILLNEVVRFDVAFFHELSPRVPLERGALVGLDPALLAATLGSWDENAVVLGRIRDVALAQGGVAIDDEVFAPSSKGRREWDRRVRRPMRLRSVMMVHLVVRSRIVSVAMLARAREPAFSANHRETLAALVPTVAVCDALAQSLEGGAWTAPRESLTCVDQRLTPRQHKLV
ncbi:MAG: hypothetical protein H5U40_19145, partial [Polyangiaceae bacterium]|nr:hypothetical protein [Polyangiaceae bacterium]